MQQIPFPASSPGARQMALQQLRSGSADQGWEPLSPHLSLPQPSPVAAPRPGLLFS